MAPLSGSPAPSQPDKEVVLNEYYDGISRAFDSSAGSYDSLYQANPIMAWMRKVSLATIRDTFAPGSRLLEIGCGTGDEALALASEGYQIVATDISPGMITAGRTKAQIQGITGVTWIPLPAGQLYDLIGDEGSGAFDGAFSSFGPLNCEPDLGRIADALARLLRPEGALVCSVMNRWCAWEISWALLHLRPGEAIRRLGPGWQPAGLASPEGDKSMMVRYYTPRTFLRALAPHFGLEKVCGLPVMLPPPYLSHLAKRYPALLEFSAYLERRLRNRFPFHSLGDHFLAVLTRTGALGLASKEGR
jgi:ubiquinone/menaquinone biosynthesis C-methylase UbiE